MTAHCFSDPRVCRRSIHVEVRMSKPVLLSTLDDNFRRTTPQPRWIWLRRYWHRYRTAWYTKSGYLEFDDEYAFDIVDILRKS